MDWRGGAINAKTNRSKRIKKDPAATGPKKLTIGRDITKKEMAMSSDKLSDIDVLRQDFEQEYASPSQWARMYRSLGWQVVPVMLPSEAKPGKSCKQPIVKWAEHERELTSDELFNKWYGADGLYCKRINMGIVTGECSQSLFVIDLDLHKNTFPAVWWQGIHDDHAGGILPDTPRSTTGGGGKHYFFRAPPGWVPPTIKTPQGIDIRGRGGFVVSAPSLHETGNNYIWDEGFEPWNIEVAVATTWLCEEVERLVLENGGNMPHEAVNPRTYEILPPVPGHGMTGVQKNEFGMITDGRESQMAKMIFGRMLDERRKDPTYPDPNRIQRIAIDLFKQYVSLVKTRIDDPIAKKHDLLEREGRGLTLFTEKMHDALRKWDTKIKQYAEAGPPPKHERLEHRQDATDSVNPDEEEFNLKPEQISTLMRDPSVFRTLTIQEIYDLPDPRYLIKDLLIENGLCFVYGAPGCCKTFIVLDMALSIAAGLPDWWEKPIERSGPVLYISSEGVTDMKFRIKAWSENNGLGAPPLPFRLLDESMNFMNEEDIDKLIRTIDKAIQGMEGEVPVLIVIDTVSRVLPGADENLQKDMTLFIRACDRIKAKFGCCTLGVHHTGRQGANMRGSTVFDGAADGSFLIAREEGAMEGQIMAKKIKSAPDGWTWDFGIHLTPLISGNTSLTVTRMFDATTKKDNEPVRSHTDFGNTQETGRIHVGGKKRDAVLCFNILNALQDDFEDGRGWSMAKNTSRDFRKNMHTLFKIEHKEAEEIIDDWYARRIISEEYNKNTKVTSYKLGDNWLPDFKRKKYDR